MNVSPRLAPLLGAAGIEAVHWTVVGEATDDDWVIIDHAAADGFVVVTHDLDFTTHLARSDLPAPSLVQIRADDLSVQQLAAVLIPVLAELAPELEQGALVTIDTARVRVRLLPLHRPQ